MVIPLHTQHFMMLQRNLLYTGVTRGKKLVVLVGSRKALEMAVQRQDMSQRCSAAVPPLARAGGTQRGLAATRAARGLSRSAERRG